ncbi:hypothetical protein BS47DRAFT_1463446, partial [Hydnum rufescens UP504]
WEEVTCAHSAHQLDSLHKEWDLKSIPNGLNVLHAVSKSGLLTAHEQEITDTVDLDTTLMCLTQGMWSSIEITTIYSNLLLPTKSSVHLVSAARHKLGGLYSHVCRTEIFVDEALAPAKGLDEHLGCIGNVVGPLRGPHPRRRIPNKRTWNFDGSPSSAIPDDTLMFYLTLMVLGYVAWLRK